MQKYQKVYGSMTKSIPNDDVENPESFKFNGKITGKHHLMVIQKMVKQLYHGNIKKKKKFFFF